MAIYKLGQICSYIEGYVNPKISDSDNFSTSGHPWLKVSELKHGGIITNSEYHLSDYAYNEIRNENQIFKKGSIVWSKSGTVGITSILGIDASANRGVLNIIPDEKFILKKYLFYFLIMKKDIFSNKATGAVIQHFYGPNLMAENILLPPLSEQQKIIDIIEPIESLQYKSSIIIEKIKSWKNKLLEVLWTEESEIVSAGDLVEISPIKFIKDRDSSGVKFLNIRNLFSEKTEEFISNEKFEEMKSLGKTVEKGDFVISVRGTLGLMKYSSGNVHYLGSVMTSLKTKEAFKEYNETIFECLKISEWQMNASGSAIPMLNNGDILSTKVKVPKLTNELNDCFKTLIELDIRLNELNVQLSKIIDNILKISMK